MTGITEAMVRGKPTFESIAESLAERLQGRLFVAHNARFDYGFLKNAFRRAGITFRADVLCTVRLSRALFPSVERHGPGRADRPLRPDAQGAVTARWRTPNCSGSSGRSCMVSYSVDLVESAVKSLVKQASLPAGLSETALDEVPDRPGVYLFYGDEDALLYVGKSTCLRQRIKSHFSGDHRHGRRCAWRGACGAWRGTKPAAKSARC